jgi:putative acetyltransferase
MQRRGIGSELVNRSLQCLRESGAEAAFWWGILCLWSLRSSATQELILDGFPAEVFLCLPITGDMPRGRVKHHQAFSVKVGELARDFQGQSSH